MHARIGCSLAALLLVFSASPAFAGDIGDPAPPLKVTEWVKGSPVDIAQGKGKNVYVVEFWATWCGPCVAAIPHVTEMQAKYKDKGVIFIGVSVDDAKTVDNVKPFVEKMGDKMNYTVAIDDADATHDAYMKAFGINGIPHCFVIDKQGKIAWHGHPTYPPHHLEKVLDLAVADKLDDSARAQLKQEVEKFQEQQRQTQALVREYLQTVASKGDEGKARELGRKVYSMIKDDPGMLNAVAWDILTNDDIQFRDKELAVIMGKTACELTKWEDAAILDTYALALFKTGKVEEAIKWQEKAVSVCTNEQMLEEIKERLAEFKSKVDE